MNLRMEARGPREMHLHSATDPSARAGGSPGERADMETAHALSDELAGLVADRLSALADPMRLRVLDDLRAGPRTVAEVTGALPTTQQNVSKHLARLHRAGLVTREREGGRVRYVASPVAIRLLDLVAGDIVRDVDALARRLHEGSDEA